MADVFHWAIAGSVLMFVIGLISALESRKQRYERSRTMQKEARRESGAVSNSEQKKAADMAAGSGIKNIDTGESLAATGHTSR